MLLTPPDFGTNDHGEPVCPFDGTELDPYPDGTLHCWRCGGEWDLP